MNAPVPVDELAAFAGAAMPFDALVVAIADNELRYTCCHCSAAEVLEDLGPQMMTAPELDTRLRDHLERRHEITEGDIRFWDGRDAAREALERAEALTREGGA